MIPSIKAISRYLGPVFLGMILFTFSIILMDGSHKECTVVKEHKYQRKQSCKYLGAGICMIIICLCANNRDAYRWVISYEKEDPAIYSVIENVKGLFDEISHRFREDEQARIILVTQNQNILDNERLLGYLAVPRSLEIYDGIRMKENNEKSIEDLIRTININYAECIFFDNIDESVISQKLDRYLLFKEQNVLLRIER